MRSTMSSFKTLIQEHSIRWRFAKQRVLLNWENLSKNYCSNLHFVDSALLLPVETISLQNSKIEQNTSTGKLHNLQNYSGSAGQALSKLHNLWNYSGGRAGFIQTQFFIQTPQPVELQRFGRAGFIQAQGRLNLI